MPFELRDHTADVAVAATAEGIAGVFAAVADGLAAAMCNNVPDAEEDDRTGRFSLSIAARTREALLYDYLADLIYERDVRAVLPVDNEVTIRGPATRDRTTRFDPAEHGWVDGEPTDSELANDELTDDELISDGPATDSWNLEANARGIALSAIDAREVKAITYSEMNIAETADGWRAYVVFDV